MQEKIEVNDKVIFRADGEWIVEKWFNFYEADGVWFSQRRHPR
jgi:hypothetical protein